MSSSKDVDMKASDSKNTDKKTKDETKKEEAEKPTVPPPTPNEEIKTNLALIEKAVLTLEPRFTHRVLRTLTTLRKKLTVKILKDAVNDAYIKGERPVAFLSFSAATAGEKADFRPCMKRFVRKIQSSCLDPCSARI